MHKIVLSILAAFAITVYAADMLTPDETKGDCVLASQSDSNICVSVEVLGVDNLDNIGYTIFNADSSVVSSFGSMRLKNVLKVEPLMAGNSYIMVFYPKEAMSACSTDSITVSGYNTSVTGYRYSPIQYNEIVNKLAEVKFSIPLDSCRPSNKRTNRMEYVIAPIAINYK